MTKLNLGCGDFPKPGFINVDRRAGKGVDVVHDLSILPYPFEDAQFERIEADHVSIVTALWRGLRLVLVAREPRIDEHLPTGTGDTIDAREVQTEGRGGFGR